jgi:hypothetical protein
MALYIRFRFRSGETDVFNNWYLSVNQFLNIPQIGLLLGITKEYAIPDTGPAIRPMRLQVSATFGIS